MRRLPNEPQNWYPTQEDVAKWREHAKRIHELTRHANSDQDLSEQLQDQTADSTNDSNENRESGKSFREPRAHVSPLSQHSSTALSDRDAVFGDFTHSFRFKEFKNVIKIVGCIAVKSIVGYMICVLKKIKRNIIYLATVISLTVKKFFKVHNR